MASSHTPATPDPTPEHGHKTMMERFRAGLYYDYDDPEMVSLADRGEEWVAEYNNAPIRYAVRHGLSEYSGISIFHFSLPRPQRVAMLSSKLGSIGAGSHIRPPFSCDFGCNIHVGSNVFINSVFLDVGRVEIGDGALIGPAVQIYTADHPRDPKHRTGWVKGLTIAVGKRAWVGGGSILLPGVVIGDDAVVGAGSVVTRSVPAGKTVAGNPARIVEKKE